MTNLLILLSITLTTNTTLHWPLGEPTFDKLALHSPTATNYCIQKTLVTKHYTVQGTVDQFDLDKEVMAYQVSETETTYEVLSCLDRVGGSTKFVLAQRWEPIRTNEYGSAWFNRNTIGKGPGIGHGAELHHWRSGVGWVWTDTNAIHGSWTNKSILKPDSKGEKL